MGDEPESERSPPSLLQVGQRTRLAAVIALGLSVFASIASCWMLYAIFSNVNALKDRNVIPQLDARFDAVAAAAAVGRLDVLSLLLAVAAVIAGLALIYSFTVFKAASIEAARHETREQLPSMLNSHLAKHGDRLVVAALKDAELVAHIHQRFTELGIDDTNDADSVDSDARWKEEQ